MARILIGIVGYYQFIRGYALGPELMARLQADPWPDTVSIKEMNWGPIAIVQDFQASAEKFDRVVLVGAVDRGLAPGTVSCRRWAGGVLDTLAVQARVFEAVTGVISIDNLLIIGAHFNVWPEELFTVEVQFSESILSDLVLAEIEMDRMAGQMAVIGERPLTADNSKIVQRIVELSRRAALDSADALQELPPLTAEQLTPVAIVSHYKFMDGYRPHRQANSLEQAK